MSRQIGYRVFKNSSPVLKTLCNFVSPILQKQEACNFSTTSLGQSSLFLQDGTTIQELPVIFRNIHGNEFEAICGDEKKIEHSTDTSQEWESQEMAAGFDRCYTAKGVFKLLELIPAEEVTPEVALQALKAIFRLENNLEFRNWVIPNEKAENFTRTAILNNLATVITSSRSPSVVLNGLQVISRDVGSAAGAAGFRDQIANQVLILAAEGRLTVPEICDAVRCFALLDRGDQGDKLWPGLLEGARLIDHRTIMDVVRILPYLKQSKTLVFGLFERRLQGVWEGLSSNDVAEILAVLLAARCVSPRVLRLLAGWLSTNIHRVGEVELLAIVDGFRKMSDSEPGVEKALEKYVKAKGLRIRNPSLFASILEYCRKFKFRSSLILTGCSEYLTQRGKDLSPSQIAQLFYPFGYLDFHPGGIEFWTKLETELQNRFVQLHPSDALDILLACVYLEKHPLNFVKKVFNPYFLDRVHSVKQPTLLATLRNRLKILDTALTLECSSYRGPLLPRDHTAKTLHQDGRIRKAANMIADVLQVEKGFLSTAVVLGQLPLSELYLVDVLLHDKPLEAPYLQSIVKGTCTALLVHVPEHYDSSGRHLIGPQVMRRRHLMAVGLKVVEIDYKAISKFSVHPIALRNYVNDKLNS